jgi:hypothetical protein
MVREKGHRSGSYDPDLYDDSTGVVAMNGFNPIFPVQTRVVTRLARLFNAEVTIRERRAQSGLNVYFYRPGLPPHQKRVRNEKDRPLANALEDQMAAIFRGG